MSPTPGPTGPLVGLKVVELASLAPAPFGCMLLADLGADVLRIDRAVSGPNGATAAPPVTTDILGRGRRSVAVDLKAGGAIELVLAAIDVADVVVEGFRPGVMEKLGLGPDVCLARNPRLIYGRMTGWGQDGPLAQAAGHDINYIALAGVLHLVGPRDGRPTPPANLLGDFAGGGLLLALGILAALFERNRSGRGQVIDAAMLDGAAVIGTFIHGLLHDGDWLEDRGVNVLDGGAPHYNTYETADGRHIAVGAIEPQFYSELLSRIGADLDVAAQDDQASWTATTERLAAIFRTRTRAEWCALLEGTDACFAPVLSLSETPDHPHNRARGTFVNVDGVVQPAPAPRFARTPAGAPAPPPAHGGDGPGPLRDWGVPPAVVDAAVAGRAIALPDTSGTRPAG